MTILELAVVFYFLFYFLVLLGGRSILLFLRTKRFSINLRKKDTPSSYNERVLAMNTIILGIIVANYLFIPENYHYLIPFPVLEIPWLQNIGIPIAIIGLILAFIAQLQMKDNWRIGIDEDVKTELVTEGLYSFSRNPIYLFLAISYLGFFLLLPSAFSALFMLLMAVTVGQKIRFEEEFMEKLHGKLFLDYKKQVRRWI